MKSGWAGADGGCWIGDAGGVGSEKDQEASESRLEVRRRSWRPILEAAVSVEAGRACGFKEGMKEEG